MVTYLGVICVNYLYLLCVERIFTLGISMGIFRVRLTGVMVLKFHTRRNEGGEGRRNSGIVESCAMVETWIVDLDLGGWEYGE